jgi:membrane-bound lytic murein transglycosylase
MYGGNKGDESRSHRDYEANEMYGGKKGDMSKSRRDYETNELHHSEEDMEEASRTYGFGSKKGRGLRKSFTNNRNLEFPINESTQKSINKVIATAKQLQTENRHFREKNKEYRQALKVFKDKLNEVAVFNANLAYSTKLFTEHSTTKKEKVNILRRFDDVKTLNESKNLFNTFNNDLNSKVNKLNESVQKTITKTPSGGSSVNLIESKTYESPQITRMREIMGKL